MHCIYFIPNQSFMNILHGYKLVRLPYAVVARTHVPEVLNVRMNEIYKKSTIIEKNKLKLKKVLNKITFSFAKVNFSLLEKKS